MKTKSKLILATFSLLIMFSTNVSAQEAKAAKQILIKNVSIFNGNSGKLITGKNVVVEGDKIKSILSSGINESNFDEVIDGKGGYLSPGLIDCHAHAVMGGDENTFLNGDQHYVQLFAAMEMEEMLLRGVTTIRDAGGNTFALKKAIDDGLVDGPRIYPSGAILSQYSGHVDFRTPNPANLPKEWGGQISPGEVNGHAMLANGPDQVMMAVRQQLFLGATQIKLAVGGGVSSFTDPLYVNEYTTAEMKAAVDAANDYGTYVMTHVFNEVGVKRAIEAGVKTIEHGHLMNEEDAKLMAEKGVILSTQCQVMAQLAPIYTDPIRKGKLDEAMNGMDNMFKLAKKYNIKVVYGTDLLFSYEGRKEQLKDLTLRKQWYNSPEIMIQATGTGGEVVGLCGKRNPYGKVGVIEEGAMADILIYSKNPLEDVSIVEDYENNLKLIIKDGKTYKNTLK
jgi:imidazolonepropionase-like amidohydrolase